LLVNHDDCSGELERMSYLLGVDGGNSKTLAVIVDQTGRVLGVGRAGCGNHQGPGLTVAMEQIRGAAQDALLAAGIEPAAVDVASYCLAGADLSEDFALLRPALAELGLARRIDLHNDSVAALRSGTDAPNAVVVVVGAGFNALGRNEAGGEIQLAGLGWLSGDWGGGDAIAQEAVRLSVRAWDGRGRPTALQEMVLEALGVPDVESLIRKLYLSFTFHRAGLEWSDVSRLAPLVFEAAHRGDLVARDLVQRLGKEVATTAATLLRRLELLHRPADVVLGGSVFRAEGTLLHATIRSELGRTAPLAQIVVPDVEPVIGAALCAMDMLEIESGEEVRRAMAESFGRGGGNVRTGVTSP
jgi:N-acetylglucosamine kinase-like BadF-type ATPase